MPAGFADVFAALKPVLAQHERRFSVKADQPTEYTLVTKSPSPFPQHKGQPLWFGSVRVGKAYVSVHLMPIYMCPEIQRDISPALKKQMQGKACFNFKSLPEPELLADLKRLILAALQQWKKNKWL